MHDFQRKGYTQYGASMGRRSDLPEDTDERLEIRRVPIDDGGYDPGGAYWGSGKPLFMVSDEEGRVRYLRARDAEDAKREFPHARWTTSSRGPSSADIEDMLSAYIEAALWSSTDESDESGGEPLDKNYGPDDVAKETVAKMRRDVSTFAKTYGHIIESLGADYDWSQAGHDLWLTRNRHGTGFWDRDLPKKDADALTKGAHALGETWLYVGDDGKIYGD
jgi:hypothetical protein